MRFRDCWKTFSDGGVSKHISPDETFRTALERIQGMRAPILEQYSPVRRPSGIPQYAFVGAEAFGQYRPWPRQSSGKGHTSSQALASGVMEMVERYSCFKYISACSGKAVRTCPFDAAGGNPFRLEDFLDVVTNPDALTQPVVAEIRKAALPFYRGYTLRGRAAYLPLRQIVYLVGTNGMAAGNTLEEAVLQAICEVIERYCLATIAHQRLATPAIETSTIASPVARDLLARLRFKGKEVRVRDFSLALGLPVVGVVRRTKRGRCLITAGVATSADEALVRALTESSEGDSDRNYVRTSRVRHQFAPGPAVDMESIPDIAEGNIRAELSAIAKLLHRRGMKAYFAETTDDELGIPCVISAITRARQAGAKPPPGSILGGIIDEYCAAGGHGPARRCLRMGKKHDNSRPLYWQYYEGLISAAAGHFDRAEERLRPVIEQGGHPVFAMVSAAHLVLCRHARGAGDGATDWHLKLHDLARQFSFERMAQEYRPVSARTKRLYKRAAEFHRELLVVERLTRAEGAALKRECEAYVRSRDAALAGMETARTQFNAGRLDRAVDQARRITRTAPMAAKVFNLFLFLARCHMGMGQYARAIAELRKAERVTPGDADILALLEQCRRKLRPAGDRRARLAPGGSLGGRVKLKGMPDALPVSAGELANARKANEVAASDDRVRRRRMNEDPTGT